MAFAQPSTLSEIRLEVATLLKMGRQALQSNAFSDIIDAYIRSAVSELRLKAEWVELRVRLSTDLIDGQNTYDFPDNMLPQGLDRVCVVDADGEIYDLTAGLSTSERSLYTSGDDPRSMPVRYEIINKEINIYPAPDTEIYKELVFEGYLDPALPFAATDAIPLDREALIKWAVAKGKMDKGRSDAVASMAEAVEYTKLIRTAQSDFSGFRVGGRYAARAGGRQKRQPLGATPNYWLYRR